MDESGKAPPIQTVEISALMTAPEGMVAGYRAQDGMRYAEIIALAAVKRAQGGQTWSEVVGVVGYSRGQLRFADQFANFAHYANWKIDEPEGTKRMFHQQRNTTGTGQLSSDALLRHGRGPRG